MSLDNKATATPANPADAKTRPVIHPNPPAQPNPERQLDKPVPPTPQPISKGGTA